MPITPLLILLVLFWLQINEPL